MKRKCTIAIFCCKLLNYALIMFSFFLLSNQCSAQSCPASGNLVTNNDTAICLGKSVTLSASGGGNSYSWTASPADASLTTPTIANPVVTPAGTTIYTVTASAANLLVNGNFENGNAGFTSGYTYVTGSTFNSTSYSINTNPNNQNSFFTTCGDHTSGSGKMMVVDGGTDGITKLWCETVAVVPNTTYTFSYWIQDVSNDADGDGHPAGLDAQINETSIGIGTSPVMGLPCGGWVQKTFTWNSGNATTADICLNDTTTFPNGNDFALDDIVFGTNCTFTKSVTVTAAVCHLPLAIQAAHLDADCTNGNGSITVLAVEGTGVAPYMYSINGGTYSTNTIFSGLSGGTYTVSVKDANTPASTHDTTITVAGCQDDKAVSIANLATGNSLIWYTSSVGGGGTSVAPVPSTDEAGVFAYYVTQSQGACESPRAAVTVTVHGKPQISAGGPVVYIVSGAAVQLKAVANGDNLSIVWTPDIAISNITIVQPTVNPTITTTYKMTVTGAGNCVATDTVNVVVTENIFIPNVFSPNGDGMHDTWLIDKINEYPGAQVKIFNRYGQLILESNGYNQPWDGTYNGKPVPVGAYYYIIKLSDAAAPIAGSVSVVR